MDCKVSLCKFEVLAENDNFSFSGETGGGKVALENPTSNLKAATFHFWEVGEGGHNRRVTWYSLLVHGQSRVLHSSLSMRLKMLRVHFYTDQQRMQLRHTKLFPSAPRTRVQKLFRWCSLWCTKLGFISRIRLSNQQCVLHPMHGWKYCWY